MNALMQGLVLGFAYVMPIGAQNIFAINTALTQRRSRILLTALIIFFFDATLAIACFFGVGGIMSSNRILELAILLAGGLIVIWIGWGIFRDKGSMEGDQGKTEMAVRKIITTACVVTWFNPQALIDGSMMLGAFRTSMPGAAGRLFIFGVCAASFIWWFGMTSVVSLFHSKITPKMLRGINIVCGIIIMAYGCKLLYNFAVMLQG